MRPRVDLSTTTLADDGERLAFFHRKADTFDGTHGLRLTKQATADMIVSNDIAPFKHDLGS